MISKPRIAVGPVSDFMGGVRTHVLNIASHSTFPVALIRYSRLSPFWPRYRGIGYLPFSTRIRSIPDPYAELYVRFRLRQFGLVHTHGHPHWLSLYRALDRARVPRIHTVHQVYERDECRSDGEWRMRQGQNTRLVEVCRTAARVIVVSEGLQRLLGERYHVESVVIPNGVDVEACEKGDARRFTGRTRLPPGFVLYVGSILGVKRPELACRIAERVPASSFVAIGPGLTTANLTALCGPLPGNLHALGPLPHESVLDAMHASAVVLVASRREASSSIPLEAFACRRPLVAPRDSGVDEIASRVSEDLVYDASDLATATRAITVAQERPELGVIGRNHVVAHYDWKVLIQRLDRAYAEVLEGTRA